MIATAVALLPPIQAAARVLSSSEAVPPEVSSLMAEVNPVLDLAMRITPPLLRLVDDGWTALSGLGAAQSIGEIGTSVGLLAESAVEIAQITAVAADIVVRGTLEVVAIGTEFVQRAALLGPSVATPVGQAGLLALATEHLARAIAVVERVQSELRAPTAQMQAVAAAIPPSPTIAGAGAIGPDAAGGAGGAQTAGGAEGRGAPGAGAMLTGGGAATGGAAIANSAGFAGGAGVANTGTGATAGALGADTLGTGTVGNGGAGGAGGGVGAAGGTGAAIGTGAAGGIGAAGGTAIADGAGSAGGGDSGGGAAYAGSASYGDGMSGFEDGGVEITLPNGSVAVAPNEQAATAVRAALSQQGVPYVWGGTTPGVGLDCSGLTQWAYREGGLEIPRLAQEQHFGTTRIAADDLMPGDLVVWSGHVAMVIGDGLLIEAGNPVGISPIRTDNIGMEFYGFYRPTAPA